MSATPILRITVESYTASLLSVKVENISGAALTKALTITLNPPADLMDARIIAASKAAVEAEDPPGVASLAGVVTGPTGWSLWAKADISQATVPIMLKNDRSQTGAELDPPVKVEAGADFVIGIPLNPAVQLYSAQLVYIYEYGTDGTSVSGTLELKADRAPFVPDVTFRSDQASPSMIKPGTPVKITWRIRDGVSASLRGPLPGGNAVLLLSDGPKSKYKMSDGELTMYAVGPVTFMLQAEVKGPNSPPNVQVVKMISLDVYQREKYAYVSARPDRVLPYGLVEVDWAAWGLDAIYLDAGGATRRIALTDLTASGYRQGIGVMRITADKPDQGVLESTVNLRIEVGKDFKTEASAKFSVIPWRKMDKSVFNGQPVGLAGAGEKLMLLTTDGPWIATVGPDDFRPINYNLVKQVSFTRTTRGPLDNPRSWLAIAAMGQKFVVLRRSNDDDLQAALYNATGQLEGAPIDLPADLRPLIGSRGTVVEAAVYNNRAYVVAEGAGLAGTVRRAFSVSFSPANVREERLLECLPGYKLLAFDDALYALNRENGNVFRLMVDAAGNLQPYKAASAVSQGSGTTPASMIKQGFFVPVGRVLGVLSPSALPTLKSLQLFGLKNVLNYQNLKPLKSESSITQDLVYNPQQNRWDRCGHGIEISPGMVCGLRGGDSPRLWIIEPNGDTYTLTLGSEHLFSHDYVSSVDTKALPEVLTKTREIKIYNSSGMQFVEMNDTCLKAGVTAFNATGPVAMNPPKLTNLRSGTDEKIEITYNEADAPTVTLRFLLQRPAGIKNEYFLELTLSGADLSTATTVFKRIGVDAQNTTSIVEVPDTRKQHSTASQINFFPKPMADGIKLVLRNATPYQLWLHTPDARDEAAREKPYNSGDSIFIKYSSTPFSIYAHGAGELFFDVDFAMPRGIEEARFGQSQTKRIRVNGSKSLGLRIESPSVTEGPITDLYECTVRYIFDKPLSGPFLGDGVPSRDGSSFYIPVASPAMANKSEILKINAGALGTDASVQVDGGSIFSAPNSLVVLSDRVLAIVKNNVVNKLTHDLRNEGGVALGWHDVVTNLKGSSNDSKFYTLGIDQHTGGGLRYKYSYAVRSLSQHVDEMDIVLDGQKGFKPARVQGAPAWVSPNTISFMDVSMGTAFAICVEGGVFLVETRSRRVNEVAIPGTGREEAVVIDPTQPVVFCAHSQPDNRALMITRINASNPNEKTTVTLPGAVMEMVTDTNPPLAVNLGYNRPRAVSLLATADTLYVSHGTKIYILDKLRLNVRQSVTVDLPCRLIQVRRGKLPGDTHPKYGTPGECLIIWAVGAMYIGDGYSRAKYQTSAYRIGVV
jgi:hypothetical protein